MAVGLTWSAIAAAPTAAAGAQHGFGSSDDANELFNALGAYQARHHVTLRLMHLLNDESGQDLIEYGLLLGIITVGAVTAIAALGPKVADYFSDTNALLP